MKEKERLRLPPLRLDLFDGSGDGGAGGADGAASPGQAPAAETPASAGAENQKQEGQSAPDSPEERRKRWQELTQGEFRDLYDEEARRLTSRSDREVQDLRERMGRSQPILNMLMERYRIGDGDLGKLLSAVENDNDAWARAAEEAGMSVEQYRQFQRMKRENAELLRQQRDRVGRERAGRQLRAWDQQAEQARAVYPGLDLGTEARNPQFLSMLRSGVPVQTAYEVIHMDEIKASVAAAQAQATEKAVTDNIRAKGARPQENGAGAGAGFTVKDDVSRLTPKDRAELARRAARGEVITF